jgi:predicted SnoaL-like aldol condensation-catalyzing enzyme
LQKTTGIGHEDWCTAADNQTGEPVTIKAADLFGIEKGTIAEYWDVVDHSEIV